MLARAIFHGKRGELRQRYRHAVVLLKVPLIF
jgi:hypothetical protein